jgi:hypothetical protein
MPAFYSEKNNGGPKKVDYSYNDPTLADIYLVEQESKNNNAEIGASFLLSSKKPEKIKRKHIVKCYTLSQQIEEIQRMEKETNQTKSEKRTQRKVVLQELQKELGLSDKHTLAEKTSTINQYFPNLFKRDKTVRELNFGVIKCLSNLFQNHKKLVYFYDLVFSHMEKDKKLNIELKLWWMQKVIIFHKACLKIQNPKEIPSVIDRLFRDLVPFSLDKRRIIFQEKYDPEKILKLDPKEIPQFGNVKEKFILEQTYINDFDFKAETFPLEIDPKTKIIQNIYLLF